MCHEQFFLCSLLFFQLGLGYEYLASSGASERYKKTKRKKIYGLDATRTAFALRILSRAPTGDKVRRAFGDAWHRKLSRAAP